MLEVTVKVMLARVLAVALRPSVCLSQLGVLSKGMNGLICFLAWWLLSASPTLCCKEFQISAKRRVLSSGSLSKLRT